MGSVARRRAYSAGGSRPEARLKGKEGDSLIVILRIEMGSLRFRVILQDPRRLKVEIVEKIVSCLEMLRSQPVLERLNTRFIVFEYFMATTSLKTMICEVERLICNTEDPAGSKAIFSGNVSQKRSIQG